MTLHDRIMALPKRTPGQLDTVKSAARMAQEADELMAEMAGALSPYAELEEIEGEGASVAADALAKYNNWKDQQQ